MLTPASDGLVDSTVAVLGRGAPRATFASRDLAAVLALVGAAGSGGSAMVMY
ncbi:MAG: hypothetical protein HC901_04350, partial [Bdellovibrionaceae bacterium]|nr:hypothetical protein [Pseudobdellovibrionaceae bacterium]